MQEVSRDVAADIVELLSSRAELPGGEPADPRARPVHPGDVAVLVSTHREAAAVREALAAAGVRIVGEDVGGDFGRSVYLHLDGGRLYVRSLAAGDVEL